MRMLWIVAFTAVLAGCSGKTSTPVAPTTTAAAQTLTSASDRAACNELEANIRNVSQLISASVEVMTQSIHPKQLAKRTGDAQKNLLLAASVLSLVDAPRSLVPAQEQLVTGLEKFAADFGRARTSVSRNEIAKAAQQLADPPALAKVTAAAHRIDRACGA